MAGNTVSGVSIVNTNANNKLDKNGKFWVGVCGGAATTMIGGFGLLQFQRKINLMSLRIPARIQQRTDMIKKGKIPDTKGPRHLDREAIRKVTDFIHDKGFEEWAIPKGEAAVRRYNGAIKRHNAECYAWVNTTRRDYLAKELARAKRAQIRNNIVGAIFTGIGILIGAWTINECTK